MATKTLILRPTSVTCDNESLVTLYPSDTVMADAHMLVNEEIADDDATYVSITGAGGVVNYHFIYKKPDDLSSIIGFTVKVKDKLESGSNTGNCVIFINDSNSPMAYEGTLSTTEYNFIICEPTDGTFTKFNEAVSNANPQIYFKRSVHTNSSKASPLRTTQVYLEITYEAIEPDTLHLNKDNQWQQIEYTSVYQKNNTSWELTDLLVLSNDQKYIIKEVE